MTFTMKQGKRQVFEALMASLSGQVTRSALAVFVSLPVNEAVE
ncbi:hypothetical protein [Rhizobium sp. CG5]|nr:hypothetical protein [Rhizobium sp. CG5]